MIKINRWSIPIEHAPFKARATLSHSDCSNPREQSLTDSLPAVLSTDVQVLQINARMTSPRRVIVEVECKSCSRSGTAIRQLGNKTTKALLGPKTVAKKICFCSQNGIW